MSDSSKTEVIGKLREILGARQERLIEHKSKAVAVRARYQPIFAPENLPKLTREDMHGFLLFKNNHHWTGLHRGVNSICADMPRLRKAVAVLLDESRPIEQRLNDLGPDGKFAVHRMGRATLTAILVVMFPDKYGVWNNTSEGAMKQLDVWPDFNARDSIGKRYAKINEIMGDIARGVGVDFWILDWLWWAVGSPNRPMGPSEEMAAVAESIESEIEGVEVGSSEPQSFGLERHLHDFLRDNWERMDAFKEWDLYEADGEIVGYEYPTTIGRIDLLARHKKEGAWLVIELKRNQSSDDTVGQAARYMGYVRDQLAGKNDRVEGLIISREMDERTRYAVSMVPNLKTMVYEVNFRLTQPRITK